MRWPRPLTSAYRFIEDKNKNDETRTLAEIVGTNKEEVDLKNIKNTAVLGTSVFSVLGTLASSAVVMEYPGGAFELKIGPEWFRVLSARIIELGWNSPEIAIAVLSGLAVVESVEIYRSASSQLGQLSA